MPIEILIVMKRICLSILLIFFSIVAFPQSLHQDVISNKVLQGYLIQYPQAQLCDVYKSCFQDYFGPGHLLSDIFKTMSYLDKELKETKIFGGPLYELTLGEGNYYRVNILLVANETIPYKLFIDAFVRSANMAKSVSVKEWTSRWNKIESNLFKIMEQDDLNMNDSKKIHEMLNEGHYMFHHSPRFNATYNFHYRIIHKDIFEKEILPLIK